MDLLEGGKRIGRKEDGCEWSHRGEGQKAGGFGSANYNASRIDCIRIERRVIILGYPLIQRLPAYRCSVEWLIRAKRPLSSPLGRVTARRAGCVRSSVRKKRGWWIFRLEKSIRSVHRLSSYSIMRILEIEEIHFLQLLREEKFYLIRITICHYRFILSLSETRIRFIDWVFFFSKRVNFYKQFLFFLSFFAHLPEIRTKFPRLQVCQLF